MEKEKNKTASWLKGHVYDVAAYAGLVITIILFLIFSGDKLMYNATTVLQTVAPYAIISLGAVFVYSMGFMDVSVGQQVGVYAILYILISNKMGGTTAGVAVAFIVVLAIALACGAFNGAVAVWLGLPSIVTSLFLMFFFTGAQLLLMEGTGNTSISIQAKIKPMDRNQYTLMLIIAIAVVAVLVTYFFKYTKFGKYTKAIGANEIAAEQSGVNTTKWKVFAYMAFGCSNWSFYYAYPYRKCWKRNWNGLCNGRYDLPDPWWNASFRRNEVKGQQCISGNLYLRASQQ